MAIFGHGETYVRTINDPNTIAESVFIRFEDSALNLQVDSDELEAQAWQRGVLSTKRTAIGTRTYTLTLTAQFANWSHLQFALDEFSTNSGTQVVNQLIETTVPETAPYEIIDTNITVANEPDVRVYITERGSWGEAKYRAVTGSAPSVGEVQVDTTGTKLVFNAADAGASVAYISPTSYTTIETIGVNGNPDQYGSVELWFKAYGDVDYPDGLWIHFPLLTRKGDPSLDFSDPPLNLEITFGALVPSGQRIPYEIFNPAVST